MGLPPDAAESSERSSGNPADRDEGTPVDGNPPAANDESRTRVESPQPPSPSSILSGDLPPTGSHACTDSTLSGKQQVPTTIGRYEVIQKIGRGGMGAVYLAKDPQLDRMVAIKVPHSDGDHDDGEARFWREARTAARLHHANICPVHEIGSENGRNFLVMAYIEGLPLSRYVEKYGPLTQRDAAIIVRKIALAMHEAHRVDVIHRDLKPSNIMMDRHREPIVMDFGLAWQAAASDIRLTRQGVVVGTPAYMPPEQIHRKWGNLGPQTDVYSLGVVLYELLTRRLPFEGDFASVVAQVVARKPPPPSQYRPDIDPKLEAICLKAMSKKADDRYPDMAALAADLTDFIRNQTPPGAVVVPKEADVEVVPQPRRPKQRSGPRRESASSSSQRLPRPRKSKSRRSDDEILHLTMRLLVGTGACIAMIIIAVSVMKRLLPAGAERPAVANAIEQPAPLPAAALGEPKEPPAGQAPAPIESAADHRTIQDEENSIELSASQAIQLTVAFPGIYSLESHWAIAYAQVSLDGTPFHEETIEKPANWSDSFKTTEMTPAIPKYTLPPSISERLASKPGTHELVVTIEVVYPKLLGGEHFANDLRTETRTIKVVVK